MEKAMRKSLTTLIGVALIVGVLMAPAADARRAKIRKVTSSYTVPTPGAQPVAGGCYGAVEGGGECFTIPTRLSDKYVKVTFTDASGQKVAGFIGQGDLNGNGISDDGYAPFCGAHPTAAAVAAPGTDLLIYASGGACADGTPALMTTGTVKIEFSKKPF
jgi:hypothetical protein